MGQRITQTIYTCDLCRKTPEDGEYLWHMGTQVWCEKCCDKQEQEQSKTEENHGNPRNNNEASL